MVNPSKVIGAVKKLKNARAVKDAKIIASSPHLKETPNMTIGQAKRMKQGTASLAKTTNRIARQSSKKGSYGSTTVGDSNAFKIKIGTDKPTITSSGVDGIPGLTLGGLTKGPANMTLNQLDRLSAIENSEKAKSYAAAYRQGKRDIKTISNAMQSNKTRAVKNVAKGTAAVGISGAAYAALQKRSK